MIEWTITLCFSVIGAILYRAGGMSKDDDARPKWVQKWMRNTKARDMGIPLIAVVVMTIHHGWHWIYILCFGLMFGAQTSYFKKKGTDSRWYNWLFVGLAFSVVWVPYSILVCHPWRFLLRTMIVTNFTVLWSCLFGTDWIEEGGRGFIQIITLPIL